MDQPGKVANPARGELDRESEYFPVPVVRDVDALAKLQVGTECMLNLPGNIEDPEGCQKVPNGCTIFKKDCTVGMLMAARAESTPHDDLRTRL